MEDEDGLVMEEDAEMDRSRFFDKNYDAYRHVTELSFGIDRIPEKLLARAQKVFSKHSSKEIRIWSSQLMKSY